MKLDINDEQAVDIFVALDLRAESLHVLADEQSKLSHVGAAGTARIYRERANRVKALATLIKNRWHGCCENCGTHVRCEACAANMVEQPVIKY